MLPTAFTPNVKGALVNAEADVLVTVLLPFENVVDEIELKSRISNQLSFYVPEITVENLIAEQNEHTLKIILTYRILISQKQDTIQVNINNGPSDGIDLNTSATGF